MLSPNSEKTAQKMADYDARYEGNGEDVDNYGGGGSSPQPLGGSHGGTDEYSDSKPQVGPTGAYIYDYTAQFYLFGWDFQLTNL